MAEGLGGRPLVVRTLDVGADKQLPCLPAAHEDNPFLGLRGSAWACAHTELLVGQLRAVLRVSADHPVRLLLPMVATVDEVRRARELLEEARQSLAAAGVPVPSASRWGSWSRCPPPPCWPQRSCRTSTSSRWAPTTWLKYVLAADRGNAAVAGLADALPTPPCCGLVARWSMPPPSPAPAGRGRVGRWPADPLAIPLVLGWG